MSDVHGNVVLEIPCNLFKCHYLVRNWEYLEMYASVENVRPRGFLVPFVGWYHFYLKFGCTNDRVNIILFR